jgi:hypothetical protein
LLCARPILRACSAMAFSLSQRLSDSSGRIVLATLLAEDSEPPFKDETITPGDTSMSRSCEA